MQVVGWLVDWLVDWLVYVRKSITSTVFDVLKYNLVHIGVASIKYSAHGRNMKENISYCTTCHYTSIFGEKITTNRTILKSIFFC